jgi:hypothetical protein
VRQGRVKRKGILQTNLLMTKNLRMKITIMRNNRGSHKQRQLTKSDMVKSQQLTTSVRGVKYRIGYSRRIQSSLTRGSFMFLFVDLFFHRNCHNSIWRVLLGHRGLIREARQQQQSPFLAQQYRERQ